MMFVWCPKCLQHYDSSADSSDCTGIGRRHDTVQISSAASHRINTAAANVGRRPSRSRTPRKRGVKRR